MFFGSWGLFVYFFNYGTFSDVCQQEGARRGHAPLFRHVGHAPYRQKSPSLF